jgi:Zn-dependent M28 family amino/carboxypeptidase
LWLFAGEEKGLVGSQFYVKNLAAPELARVQAMVNMDTLGLGPTEVWASRSDPSLLRLLVVLAHALNLPLTGVNVDGVGESDEESFIKHKIPAMIIHSLTQATIPVLHSPKDKYEAIHQSDYYDTYRLLSGFLALLDERLATDQPAQGKSSAP